MGLSEVVEGVRARRACALREAFLDFLCLLRLSCRCLLCFLGRAGAEESAAPGLCFALAGLGSPSATAESVWMPFEPEAASEPVFFLCLPDRRLVRLALVFFLRRGGSVISETPPCKPESSWEASGAGGASAGSNVGVPSAECQLDFASPASA